MGRAIAFAGLVLLGFTACVESASHVCGFGRVCPPETQCDEVMQRCIAAGQLEACGALEEGDVCEFAGTAGVCVGGACVTIVCGNGIVDPGEMCDDGNLLSNDMCRADCRSDETCGNGVIDFHLGEECDCGRDATAVPAGCSAPNDPSGAALCRSDCKLSCGDGVIAGAELCDGTPPVGRDCMSLGYDYGGLTCSAICTPALDACGELGWRPLAVPVATRLSDVWGVSADDFWAVGPTGSLLHYTATGFEPSPFGAMVGFEAIDGEGAALYAVGALSTGGGVVYHFDGASWNLEHMDTALLNDVWVFDDDTVFVTTSDGRVLRKTGASWSSDTLANVESIWGTSPTNVYAVTNSGEVWHYDGSWSSTPVHESSGGNFHAIWGSGPDDIFVVGSDFSDPDPAGLIVHFDGTTWTPLTLPVKLSGPFGLLGVSGTSADDVFIVGGLTNTLGFVLRYDGSVLYQMEIDASQPVEGIHVWPDGRAVAVSQFGTVFEYAGSGWGTTTPDFEDKPVAVQALTNGDTLILDRTGKLWRGTRNKLAVETTFTTAGVVAAGVFATSPANVWAVADDQLRHYDGTQWSTETVPNASLLRDVWSPGGDTVFVIDNFSGVHVRDGGVWTETSSVQPLYGITGRSATDVYAVGFGGTILHFDGQEWTPQASNTEQILRDVFAVGGEVYAVGFAGTILHLEAQGWTAMPSPTALPLRAIWGVAPDDLFAAGDNEAVLHWDGASWSRVRPPAFAGSTLSISGNADRVWFVGDATPPVAELARATWP